MYHNCVGYIDAAAGKDEIRANYQAATCAECHDPHDATTPTHLCIYDTVAALPDDTEIRGVGAVVRFMSCPTRFETQPKLKVGRISIHLTTPQAPNR